MSEQGWHGPARCETLMGSRSVSSQSTLLFLASSCGVQSQYEKKPGSVVFDSHPKNNSRLCLSSVIFLARRVNVIYFFSFTFMLFKKMRYNRSRSDTIGEDMYRIETPQTVGLANPENLDSFHYRQQPLPSHHGSIPGCEPDAGS